MKLLDKLAVVLFGLLFVGGSCAVAQTPPFASSYSWTSTGPLISAQNGYIAVKDPSAVLYNGRWVIYASTVNSAGDYGMEYLNVAEDFSDAATAQPTYLKLGGTAPQIFYFAPQNKWYLITEWGMAYSTNSDPTQPLNWSPQTNFNIQMPSGVSGIDPWIICDSVNCYFFQCADNGYFYRSSTPIGDFPNGFSPAEVVASDTSDIYGLFEADNVYTVEGTGGYLANIEALGPTGRYFRALWASSLDGTWYDLGDTANFATPFLGQDNVTFESGVSAWTTSFSSGGLLIDGNDQTDSVNPKNLAFLYQGASESAYLNDPYGSIPWQLGVAYSNANTTTCTATAITPYISVSGTWTEESSATVSSTSTAVDLGPQPLTGGSWSWTGPNGFTSTAREIDNIALSTGVNNYVATYTNSCGSKSTQAFAITVTGSAAGFTLTPSASTLSVKQGASGTDTITVADTGGFTGSVAFTVSGLPSGVTAAFSPTSSTTSSVLTLTAGSTATTGAFTVTVTGTSGSTTATTTFTLDVTASTSGSACTVDYTISPQNSSQFGANITIINGGSTTLSNWVLTWSFANGQTISSSWNGTVSQSGANVTVSEQAGQTWENIPAGGSYTGFGFNGTWNGTANAIPTAFSLNGTACTVN